MTVRIITGDCREVLRSLPAGTVNCCVTSPPYFGLRDYGVEGQIGLEPTPDAFVAEMVGVFREVCRVLKDDATLWLNLGDSYANDGKWGGASGGKHVTALHGETGIGRSKKATGLKPKDLIGIPWAVATALRDPYYTGSITRERDRVWLAAMIDGEGTICGFHHVRADDGRPRTGVHVTITNSSTDLLDEAHRIWPASRSEHEVPGAGHYGSKDTWRWICHGIENKTLLMRELYPYLVVKKRQAIVAYNLLLLMADAKRLGHTSQRDAVREKRKFLTDLMSSLNQCEAVDLPSWLVEPPSVFEPGYFLRQDIIWSKPNPMPESVRDRCTKAHEYLFMLSKSHRYYYDGEAIKEPASENPVTQARNGRADKGIVGASNLHGTSYGQSGRGGWDRTKLDKQRGHGRRHAGFNDRWDAMEKAEQCSGLRNKRSVWTVATQPFSEAHFATFPPALIEPCIKAGCPEGGTVLDPFGGAGTTGLVADRLNRNAILIELNPEYAAMAERRIRDEAGMMAQVTMEAA